MSTLAPHSVMLLDQLTDTPQWRLFANPIAVLSTSQCADVMHCLDQAQTHVAQGRYVAGYVSYEAAAGMDPMLTAHPSNGTPLVWLGVYEHCVNAEPPSGRAGAFTLTDWRPSVSPDEYRECIAQIKTAIKRGDTYQVNYTLRLRSSFSGDPWALFAALHQAQCSDYSAYIHLGRYHVCCASPELFFSRHGHLLTCKPMKGTARRGATPSEDLELQQWLHHSKKNRAENVMIVDMIRNDAGRIAVTGSVKVEELFAIEKYPTVLQMTSTVTAEVFAPESEIFRQMFPSASITGAPKVKTMEIISGLEPDPRGIYTGAIGYLSPDGSSQFNVAIRTAVVDTQKGVAEYGVGGGIVWDSNADEEYEEWRTKARVLDHITSAR
jgi:para-aminobenzoate synthetase/4-amino-4-deoxychorismate lyase